MHLGSVEIVFVSLIGLAALAIVVGLPVWLGIRYAWREREMEHTERMKAMELGLTLPKDQPWTTPGRLSAAIGAGVPIGAFFLAFIDSQGNHHSAEAAWVAAGFVGVAGVIAGTILATRLAAPGAPSRQDGMVAKPDSAYDPEAYDVVSRRG